MAAAMSVGVVSEVPDHILGRFLRAGRETSRPG
jgi:hypothetical protein